MFLLATSTTVHGNEKEEKCRVTMDGVREGGVVIEGRVEWFSFEVRKGGESERGV